MCSLLYFSVYLDNLSFVVINVFITVFFVVCVELCMVLLVMLDLTM